MRRSCLILLTTRWLAVLLVITVTLFSGMTRGEHIALDALSHLDAPYVFGRSGPEKFDCSGLIVHCFAAQGISVSHSAETIGGNSRYRTLTNPSQLRVGDIVCFDTVNDRDPSDHVGIWLGGNSFVHASSGKSKVMVSTLEGYYFDHFSFGKRIICPWL